MSSGKSPLSLSLSLVFFPPLLLPSLTFNSVGPQPLKLLNEFFIVKDRALDRTGVANYNCSMFYLCPFCVQGIGIISVINSNDYKCDRGHIYTSNECLNAMPFDPVAQRTNNLWAPRRWELFYSQGDWKTTAGRLRYTDLVFIPQPRNLIETVRNEEFIRGAVEIVLLL